MTLLSSPMLEAIFCTVEALPQSSIENMCAILEAETMLSSSGRTRLLQSVALTQERIVVTALLGVWLQEATLPHPVDRKSHV